MRPKYYVDTTFSSFWEKAYCTDDHVIYAIVIEVTGGIYKIFISFTAVKFKYTPCVPRDN